MATKNELPIKSDKKRTFKAEREHTCEVCGKGTLHRMCPECLDEAIERVWEDGQIVWVGPKEGQDSFLIRTAATSDQVRASIAERQRRNLPVLIKSRYETAKRVCKAIYGVLLDQDTLQEALDGDEPEEVLFEMDFGAIPNDPQVAEDVVLVFKEVRGALSTDRIVDAVFVRQGGVLELSRASAA